MTAEMETGPPPSTIMDHVYGVYGAFALLSAMQLDLFTPLGKGPMGAAELSASLELMEKKLSPLLYCLVAAKLLRIEEGKFANTPETERFLVRGRPDYMGGMSGFYAKMWQAALGTAESIRTGTPQARIDYAGLTDEALLNFFKSQVHSSRRAGREIAERLDFSDCRGLLDAGGGTGGVAMAVCEKYPRIEAVVTDLPNVTRISGKFIQEAGMGERIKIVSADLCEMPPPGSFDTAILRALLQTLSPEQASRALLNIGRAMVPGGKIHIIGSILDDSRLSPPSSVAFGMAFVNVYDEGRAYTVSEHKQWIEAAGFAMVGALHNTFMDGLGIIEAVKK